MMYALDSQKCNYFEFYQNSIDVFVFFFIKNESRLSSFLLPMVGNLEEKYYTNYICMFWCWIMYIVIGLFMFRIFTCISILYMSVYGLDMVPSK